MDDKNGFNKFRPGFQEYLKFAIRKVSTEIIAFSMKA